MTYLITGGAGFIGANFVKYLLKKYQDCRVVVLDNLTYAGNLGTIEEELGDARVTFVKGDIARQDLVENIFENHPIDTLVNFAAESHVDRSIKDPRIFLETNVLGTQNLLDTAKAFWTEGKDKEGFPAYKKGKKFVQISTDEVYGDLERDIPGGQELTLLREELSLLLKNREKNPQIFGTKFFTEELPLRPRSPYAASKAGADLLVLSYGETYRFPVNITRCSNNYGPFHFPEKLIPLIIKNVLEGRKIPLYGDGRQVRDWLYVEDHCRGIDLVINKGRLKEVYNIGGLNEEQNINIAKQIIDILRERLFENQKLREKYKDFVRLSYDDCSYDLLAFVQDRLGHDVRYAIDPAKTVRELGFCPETAFAQGIGKTIDWYLENQRWVSQVTSGDYQEYYQGMYGETGEGLP